MALPAELFAPVASSHVSRSTQPSDLIAALLANTPIPGLPPPGNPVVNSNIDWIPHKRRLAEPEHKLITAAERYPDEQLRFYGDGAHSSGRGHVSPHRAMGLNSGQMLASLNPQAPLPSTGLATYGVYKPGPLRGDPHGSMLSRQEAHKDSITALIAGNATPEKLTTLRKKAPLSRLNTPGIAGAPYGLTGINTPAYSPSKLPNDMAFGGGCKGTSAGRGNYLNLTLRSDNVAALILEAGGSGAPASHAPPSKHLTMFPPDERGAAYVPTRATALSKPTEKGSFGWSESRGMGSPRNHRERRTAMLQSDGVASLLRPSTAAAADRSPRTPASAAAASGPALSSTSAAAYVSPSQQVRPATAHSSRRHGAFPSAANDPYKVTSIF